jgi:hypothetical protein
MYNVKDIYYLRSVGHVRKKDILYEVIWT